MSTSYGWEGIRQVCATLLGARHVLVPERLRGTVAFPLGLRRSLHGLEANRPLMAIAHSTSKMLW